MLAPQTIHWHIYTLADDDGEPRIAMTPANLVQAEWKQDEGILQFHIQELEEDMYDCDDDIQAGVALWLPASYLTDMEVSGVGLSIIDMQYTGSDPITITNAGIGTVLSVTSVQAPIQYTGSGVNTEATLVAAAGSSVELSGVKGRVAIAVPPEEETNSTNTTTTTPVDERLQVRLSGVGTAISIDGAYGSIYMEGVNAQVMVNTDCDRITSDGIGTGCSVDPDLTVAIADDDLTCLAETVVARVHTCWGNWRGAVIGATIGVLVVAFLCCGGCVACCCLCGRGGRREAKLCTTSQVTVQKKEMPVVMGRVVDAETPAVPEATTMSTVIPIDPHLISANTGTEPQKPDVTGAYL